MSNRQDTEPTEPSCARFRRRNLGVPTFLLFLLLAHALPGQTRVPVQRLGADMLRTQDGHRLLGLLIGRESDDEIWMVVERAWLETRHAELAETQWASELAAREELVRIRMERLEEWMELRRDESAMHGFLESEHRRLVEEAERGPESERSRFTVFRIPREQIEGVFVQPPPRRRVLLAAWREELRTPTERATSALLRELREREVTPDEFPAHFDGKLPPVPETDRQWAARMALVEFRLRKPIEFQGTGNSVFRVDGREADVTKVLEAMMAQRLEGTLRDLLGQPGDDGPARRPNWQRQVTRAADDEQARGVLVTQLSLPSGNAPVAVELQFLARMPDGSWTTVLRLVERAEAGDLRAEDRQRVADDPQVQEAVRLIQELGISSGQLERALDVGAATMSVHRRARSQFLEVQERLTRLDGPPLMLPNGP